MRADVEGVDLDLDAEDVVLGLWIVLIVAALVVSRIRKHARKGYRAERRHQRRCDIGEETQQYLAEGGEIRLPQWHGADLVLTGELELDADAELARAEADSADAGVDGEEDDEA